MQVQRFKQYPEQVARNLQAVIKQLGAGNLQAVSNLLVCIMATCVYKQ